MGDSRKMIPPASAGLDSEEESLHLAGSEGVIWRRCTVRSWQDG